MSTRTITTKLVLDGEAEYRARIKNINAELALHKSELEKVQAQYKTSANSMEALSAKQSALKGQLDALNQRHSEQAAMLAKAQKAQQEFAAQTEALRSKLEALKNSSSATAEEEQKLAGELAAAEENMQKAANSVTFYQKQLNNTERDQAKLSVELDKTGKYLDEAKASADGCAHSIDQYGKEVKGAAEESEKFGDKSKEAINQLATALASAGVAKSVKEIADELMACAAAAGGFETALAKLSTLMVPQSMEGIKAELIELSNETGVAVGALAEAAYQARSAGVDAAGVIDFVSTATKTSAAGFTDSAAAVDVLTTAINAYKLEGAQAERVASMLVKTQDEGKTSVDELAQNMGRVIPLAAAYHVNLGNLSASYAILTKNGTNTAISTTNLTALFTELARDGSTVADVLQDRTGKSFSQLMADGSNLGQVMEVLSDSVDGDATAFSNLWGSTTAGQAALTLLNAGAEEFTRTLGVMETSSGAVDRNFQTMADTTEHAQQRMANAAQNLRIAVGDQLNPALEQLYSSGSDAFTWAADFVQENPWVVGAIVGTTAALGALAVGTAALSAAPAIIGALNTALGLLAANPVVAVTAAVVGLTVATATWLASLDDADEKTRAFTSSLKDSRAAYEELTSSMAEEQASTRAVAASLRELLSVEEKSATQKELIQQKVDQLNEAVPELGLAYDREKDALAGLTEAELDSALARAEAKEEYEAQVSRLSELYTEQAEISARLAEAEGQLAEAEKTSAEAGNTAASSYADAADAHMVCASASGELNNTIRELTAAQAENAAQIAALEEASRAYGEQQAADTLAIETMTATVEGLIGEMDELVSAYEESYTAAMESIDSQLGLFNELDGAAKTSIDSLIGTLKGQVEYMETYAANIQKAMEMGVDMGLVKKLSDGSEESAQILAAIVQGGEEDIRELNEQLARVEEGKEDFSQAVADMETDFSRQMDRLVRDLDDAIREMDVQDEARRIGGNNIQGLINGAASKRQALVNQYAQMGRDALAAYKRAVDQHSPSKKFDEAGRFDIQGLIGGVRAETPKLIDTYEDAAQAVLDGMARHLPSSVEEPRAAADFDRRTAAILSAVSDRGRVEGGNPIYIDKMVVRDESDINRIARELYSLTRRESRERGGGCL